MKRSIVLVALVAIGFVAFADNKADYEALLSQGRYEELLTHLTAWEREEPENPEMFIGWFNYHIAKGRESGISIDRKRRGTGPAMTITNPETGEVVGYMNDSVQYDPDEIGKAFGYIDRGLGYCPNRLDMHFGKIHLLTQIEDYNAAGKALKTVFDLASKNESHWLWSDNEKVEDGQEFLLNNVQDYYQAWMNAETEESLDAFLACNMKQIQVFPKSVYAYNNVAVFYSVRKDFDNALGYFLKAEGLDPNDCVVIINIGLVYLKLGDKDKARAQFEKAVLLGGKEEREYAQKMLGSL